MMQISYGPKAEAELMEAVLYYESQRPELGRELLGHITMAENRAARNPGRYRIVRRKGQLAARRIIVERFPYALIFTAYLPSELRIIALAHFKRRPNYWASRLQS